MEPETSEVLPAGPSPNREPSTPETEIHSNNGDSVNAERKVGRRPKSASDSLSSISSSSTQDSSCPTDDGGDSMTSSNRSDEPHYDVKVKVQRRSRQGNLGDIGATQQGGETRFNERKNGPRGPRRKEPKKNVQRQQQQQAQTQPQASTPRDTGSVNSLSPRSQNSNNGGGTVMKDSRSTCQGRSAASPTSDGTAGRERSQPPSRSSVAPSAKSISSSTSHEFDDRSPGVALAPPYGRTEPKFEPRFSHYKANTVEGVKWDSAYFVEHRIKIAKAKPIVDTKPPTNFSHVQVNMRKLKLTQDRQDEIERDNKLLLGRLVRAMTTTRIDNWNDIDQRMKPSSRSQQRRNILQVAAENRKILERLNERQSTVSSSAYYARQVDDRGNGMTSSSGHHQRHLEAHRSAQHRHQHKRHDSDGGAVSRTEVEL